MKKDPRTRRVLVIVPCSPYFPSGLVRIEQYRKLLRADGVELDVRDYLSALQRRFGSLVVGPHRLRSALARQTLRVLLRLVGAVHELTVAALVAVLALRFDAVIFQWILPPRWLIRWVSFVNRRLVYDFDDATFLEHPARAELMVQRSWRVVAGSHLLYDYAVARNPRTTLIPSPVPLSEYLSIDDSLQARPGVPTIGWIGSSGTLPQLRLVWPALERLAAEGVKFQLLVAGVGGRPDMLPDSREFPVILLDSYDASELPRLVDALDVGIMPLLDGPWERGKCAMKAIVYMAGAKPVVASPVGESCHVVADGESGYLPRSDDEWVTALRTLLSDPSRRRALGARGRQIVAERYSVEICYHALRETVFAAL